MNKGTFVGYSALGKCKVIGNYELESLWGGECSSVCLLYSKPIRSWEANSVRGVRTPRENSVIGAVAEDFKHRDNGFSPDKGIHSVKFSG